MSVKEFGGAHFDWWVRERVVFLAVGSCVGAMMALPVAAAPIDTGNPLLRVYWDNTAKYSVGVRVENQDGDIAAKTTGPETNTNDGDNNFDPGLISNRVDLLSEFGLNYDRKYGFRVSAAAWYDDVYHRKNDNPGTAVNHTSTPYNEFTKATKELHGGDYELLDSFVYGNFTPGDMRFNVKAGRFTQLYGESLFFGSNGIAAAQTSLDLVKALSVPNSQFKEIMRPTNQVSVQAQVTPEWSVGAYYQLEWRKNRLPGAGSYFSFADFVDAGGETLSLAPGTNVYRGQDIEARNTGQGGFQVKYAPGDVEYGLYAAQYHDKMPQFYARPGVNAKTGYVGDYMQVFGEKIRTVGGSVSTLVGDTNVAVEASYRTNMPLVATGNAVVAGATADNDKQAMYPTGKTLHLNVSSISVFNENEIWDGASLLAEFAANRRMSVDKNANQLDPRATQHAGAVQFLLTPEYFQVYPGVDLKVPVGLSYGLFGRSSVNGSLFPSTYGGNVTIGVQADINKTWQAGIGFTHYYGPSGSVVLHGTAVPELSYNNFHGDRDFISLSIQRTF